MNDTRTDACPFCNSPASAMHSSGEWNVWCNRDGTNGDDEGKPCYAMGPSRDTEAEAIKAWNARPTPATDDALETTPTLLLCRQRDEINALTAQLAEREATIAKMTEALEWYEEQAIAANRAMFVKATDAMTAILTSMSLDCGNRARAALESTP
jgi:hypothetical protein